MSRREWQLVDGLWMAGRQNLREDDLCYFYFVRDPRGFPASHDNDVMMNFKHSPVRYPPGSLAYAHKVKAVRECAGLLAEFLESGAESGAFDHMRVTLVPMPTSMPRIDGGFDNRIDSLCDQAAEIVPWVGVEKALDVSTRLEKSHMGGTRDIDELATHMRCERMAQTAEPRLAILVDDVLTTGAHYAACKRLMAQANPHVRVMGAFMSIYVRQGDYGYGKTAESR